MARHDDWRLAVLGISLNNRMVTPATPTTTTKVRCYLVCIDWLRSGRLAVGVVDEDLERFLVGGGSCVILLAD